MPIALLFAVIGLLLLVWLWTFVQQLSQSKLRDMPVETGPIVPVNLISNRNGVLVSEGRGHLVYINARAREWFGMNGSEPNLAVLASRVEPNDVFHDLFADEGQASFRLGVRRIQATSHAIPGLEGRQMVVVMRELTLPSEEEAVLEAIDPTRAMVVLQEISQTITEGLELKPTLNALLSSIGQVLPYDAGEITLWDHDLNILRPIGRMGDRVYADALDNTGGVYEIDEGFTGWIARYQQPLLLPDISVRSDVTPKLENFPFLSYIGLPLRVGERFIGTLELASRQRDAFDHDDQAFLESIAGQAAIAIENAHLSSGQASHLVHLTGLQHIVQAMDEQKSMTELYGLLTERIANLMNVQICGLLLYDEKTESLVSQTPFYGVQDDIISLYRIPAGEGTVGREILRESPWWYSNDVINDERVGALNMRNLADAIGLRSAALVPLSIGERRPGLVQIANKRDGVGLNEDDMRLLSIFAAQAAVVIENARLQEYEQQYITDLGSLQELAGLTDWEGDARKELLEKITASIAGLLHVENCGILFYEENTSRAGKTETFLVAQHPFYGIDEESIRFYQIPVVSGSVFEALRDDREHWISNDVTRVDDWSGALNFVQQASMVGLRKVLMLPLIIQGKRPGILQVGNKQDGSDFTESDVRLLQIAVGQTALLLENLRASRESERLSSGAEGIRRVATHIARNIPLEEMVPLLLPDIVEVMGSDVVAIGMLSSETSDLTYRNEYAYGVSFERQIALDVYDADFDSSPIITRRPVRIENIRDDENVLVAYRAIAETMDVQSMMQIPLVINQRILGEMIIATKTEKIFGDHEENVALTIGSLIASAIERAQLPMIEDSDIRARLEEQDALDRITRELGETLLLDRVMTVIRNETLRTTAADDTSVVLLMPVDQWEDDAIPAIEQRIGTSLLEENNEYNIHLTPVELEAFQKKQTIHIEDYAESKQKPLPATAGSALIQPVRFGEEVVGLIHLYTYEARAFDTSALNFIQRLGQQASLAVSNARRYNTQLRINERLRRRANQVEQIFGLSQLLREGAGLADLMQEVAYAISETVGFNVVLISTQVRKGEGYAPIAQAGLPLSEFRETSLIVRPSEMIKNLLKDRWKISNSYLFPAEERDQWASEDMKLVETPESYVETTRNKPGRTWNPEDLILVPMLDSSGELLGYISPDSPQDGKRPDIDTFESLEVFASQAAFIIENFKLVESVQQEAEATRRERDRLAQLHLISREIQLKGDLNERLQIIADGIAAAGWQRVQLTLRDEKMEPTMLIYSGYSEEEAQRIRAKMLPGTIWRQRFNDLEFHDLRLGGAYYLRYDSPWVQKNFFKGGRKPDPPRVGDDTWHPQDSIYLPLMGQDQQRIIGLIRMEMPLDGKRPTEASLQPIELFALQAAAAIENTRLYEETVRQAQTEQRLNELMEAMASTLDQTEIIRALALGIRPVVELDRIHIALPDDEHNNKFEIIRVEYTADGKIHIFPDTPMEITTTAMGQVFHQGESEIVNLTIEYQFKDHEDLRNWVTEGERSTMMVPMVAGGETIGVVRLGTSQSVEEAFSDIQNLNLIQRMANLSAVSFQNSRLFGSLETTTSFNQGIVESIQQGIVVLDNQMIIQTVNTFMIKRYGWGLEAIGRALFSYRPDFKDFLENPIETALQTGTEQHQFDVQDVDHDNNMLIRNFYTYPLRQGERVTGVVLLVEDITDRALLAVELKNRADQLTALTNVSNQMTQTLQPDQVGEVVLDALGTVLPYDAVALWLMDADNERRLAIKAARGFDDQGTTPEELIGLWVEIASSKLFAEMASEQRVINIADTTHDKERFPYGEQRVYKNWLGAPLISKGQVIGVLQLEKKEINYYNENHEQLVAAFANQAAVALNNAQLFAETQERAEELNRQAERLALLNRVSTALAHSLDQENIFEITLLRMSEALSVEEAAAIKIDAEDNMGRVVIEYPRGDEEPAIAFRLSSNEAIQNIMTKTSPTLIENFPRSIYAEDLAPIMRRTDVYTTLFVPLVLSGAVVGVMRFDGVNDGDTFTPEQINLAQTISSQAAIAVQNASLYEQSVRRTYELQTLFDASQSIAVTLDADDVNRRVATLILIALQADTSTVMMWDNMEGHLELAETTAAWEELEVDERGTIYQLEDYPVREKVLMEQNVKVLRLDNDDLDEKERANMEKRGVYNRLFAPLVVNEVSIGLVQVEMRDRVRFFESDQLRLVRTLTTQTAIAIENARLQTETRTQLEELYLINDISQAVSGTVNFEGLLEQVREQLPMLTEAQYIYLGLYNSDNSHLHFSLAIDEIGQDVPVEDSGINENDEFGYMARHQMPLLLSGEDVKERRKELGITSPIFKDAKSFLGIPMIGGDQVIGVLALRDDEEHRKFSLSEQRILTTVASQLAVAIQNARLFQQTAKFAEDLEQRVQERTRELEQERQRIGTLYEIASEIAASTLDLDRVLTRTLEAVARAIGATSGVVLKVDEISDRLYVMAQIGLDVDHEDERLQLGLNEGLAGWIIQNRQGVVIEDVQNDYRWIAISDREKRPRAAVAALLESGEDVGGVMMFYNEEASVFTEDHQRLVAAAASQLANAMNSAELYGLIRDQAERLGSILRQEQVDSTKNNAILDSIADGVMYANEKGIIRQFNQMAERILGLTDEQVLNRHINELAGIYGGRAANWMDAIQKWMDDPTLIQAGEFQEEILNLEDGQIISVRLSPVNMGDQFLGTVSVFRDITREVAADRLKSKFVENVSHELRTPMTSIKGYADLLLLGAAGQISEAQQRFLQTIKQNADRLTILVNDLLEVSRIDQKRKLHFTAVDVSDVMNLVSSYLAGRIKEEGKDLKVDMQVPQGLPHIRADYDKIIQVIQNLADNAFNYTEQDGTITLSAQYIADDNAVVIAVADSGIGIPEEVQDRIFERFFRGDEYSQAVFDTPGTGLGLAIVKELVDLHNGEISFTSEPGKGSTFYVKIRVAGYVAEEDSQTPGNEE